MAAIPVSGIPPGHKTNSAGLHRPLPDQEDLREVCADRLHSGEVPRKRALVQANAFGKFNIDIV